MKKQYRVRVWFEERGILSHTDRQRAESDLAIYRMQASKAADKGDEEAFARYCAEIERLEKQLGG